MRNPRPALEGSLKAAGHNVTITEDTSILASSAGLNEYNALVFNTRRENPMILATLSCLRVNKEAARFHPFWQGLLLSPHFNLPARVWPETMRLPGEGGLRERVFILPTGSSLSTLAAPAMQDYVGSLTL
jgi:hypothetical protein